MRNYDLKRCSWQIFRDNISKSLSLKKSVNHSDWLANHDVSRIVESGTFSNLETIGKCTGCKWFEVNGRHIEGCGFVFNSMTSMHTLQLDSKKKKKPLAGLCEMTCFLLQSFKEFCFRPKKKSIPHAELFSYPLSFCHPSHSVLDAQVCIFAPACNLSGVIKAARGRCRDALARHGVTKSGLGPPGCFVLRAPRAECWHMCCDRGPPFAAASPNCAGTVCCGCEGSSRLGLGGEAGGSGRIMGRL